MLTSSIPHFRFGECIRLPLPHLVDKVEDEEHERPHVLDGVVDRPRRPYAVLEEDVEAEDEHLLTLGQLHRLLVVRRLGAGVLLRK